MGKSLLTFLGIFAFLGSAFAAGDLSPIEVYARCHAKLSDHPVDIDSAEYKRVATGQLDPVEACEAILDKAMFKKGAVRTIKKANDKIALGVLRNFQAFHMSWFTNYKEFAGRPRLALYQYRDVEEPGLFLTDALFADKHYRQVFTFGKGLQGVRRGPKSAEYTIANIRLDNLIFFSGPNDGRAGNTVLSNTQTIDFKRKVDTGWLIGVRDQGALNMQLPGQFVVDEVTERRLAGPADTNPVENLGKSMGGGILGSMGYFLQDLEANQRPDGGVRVYRRHANSIYTDLMCLTLPTLNNQDIAGYMSRYKKSQLSFRQSKSCAYCHASLDWMADTYRNNILLKSASISFRNRIQAHNDKFREMDFVKQLPPRVTQQSSADADNIYHRRTPKGRLLYRDYNGKKVNRAVTGVAELGRAMAAQDDVYMCAAQRYYHFLTGVNISVSQKENSDFYKTHRKEIISLGKRLKKHGSLKKLVVDILRTDAFQSRSPGRVDLAGGE